MFVASARQSADVVTLPSPVGGLNAVDSLAAMPATDAIVMTNIVPQPYGCTVRKGTIEYAVGMPDPVTTLAELARVDGSQLLYAWAGARMYNATTIGPVGAAVITGLTNAWWQHVIMSNSAGTHLVAFNGADSGIWIHGPGPTYDRLVLGDGIVSGTWKNIDPVKLIQCTVHQRRLWAVEEDSTRGWYLAPDSVYGAATSFDFGPLFKKGGYLTVLATWTVDAGSGSNDKLVAISSNGEAAVYAGTDPSSAGTWQLVGVYFIGMPVRGRRFYTNVAGDLFLITYTGVVSMATVVTSTQVNVASNNTYSRKIQFLLSELTTALGEVDGWQLEAFPSINLLYVNVPSVYAGGAGQIVGNQINQTWCLFTGLPALCWARVSGNPFFGTADGKVMQSWIGDQDNIGWNGATGTNILSRVQQAYNYFSKQAVQKQIGMFRPNLMVVRDVAYTADWTYDFKVPAETFPTGASPTPIGVAIWGSGTWGTSLWSGGLMTQREWSMAEGIGVAGSLNVRLSTNVETTWVSTDLSVKSGGIL